MKKRTSKILSILLAFALIVSTGDVVRAEDVDGQKTETQGMTEVEVTEPETEQSVDDPEITAAPAEDEAEVLESVMEEPKAVETKEDNNTEEMDVTLEPKSSKEIDSADMSGAAKDLIAQASVNQKIPVKIASTGNERLTSSEMALITYNAEDVKGSYAGYSEPFTVSAKGTLNFFAAGHPNNLRLFYFGVYRDADMTQEIGSWSVSRGNTDPVNRVFEIPSAGTYYIGVKSKFYSYEEAVPQIVAAGAIFYNGADRAISSGQEIAVGQKNAQTNYFAIKASSTGYLMAQGDNTAKYYKVALCDSSKKALSGESYLTNAPTYGVKAKKTYYLRVTSSYNSLGAFKFKATNTKISEKSGKTKKKAVTIKKKQTRKGTVEAGSAGKQIDWYKFKLSGKKSVRFAVTTGSNDAIKIIFYKGSKKISSKTVRGNATGTISSVGKWTKGTYYIRVQRGNSKSSGYYTLKWK